MVEENNRTIVEAADRENMDAIQERSIWKRSLYLWPLLLPVLLWVPGWSGFPYPSTTALFSDVSITHFPNALFLKRAILSLRTIPLWSPAILSGYPFAANPLAGLWYPPGWLALFFQLPFGFNLDVGLHLLWGGLGMVAFLRQRGLARRGALLGGLFFEAFPKLVAHYGAGHLTLLYAIPWTPWLLWSSARSRTGGSGRGWLIRPGLILGMILLADVRWAAYAALLWWIYETSHSLEEKFRITRNIHPALAYTPIRKTLGILVRETTLGVGLSAILLLPLVQYTSHSTRAGLLSEQSVVLSLPPARLLGLVFPEFGGQHEWVVYPGVWMIILAMVRLFVKSGRGRAWFWVAVFGASMALALGEYFILFPFLARLPGFSLLRVPPRFVFLSTIAIAYLAGDGLDTLFAGHSKGEGRRVNMLMAGLCGFTALILVGARLASGTWGLSFLWGAGMAFLAWIWITAIQHNYLPHRLGFGILVAMVLLDWGFVNRSLLTFRNREVVLGEGAEAAAFVAGQPGVFRIYSPSYSLPQQTAALYNLELADGVDPLQLEKYRRFMEVATGIPQHAYSVTLPPFPDGDPGTAHAGVLPDPARLGWLNVQYVLAAYDLPLDDLEQLEVIGDTRIYLNHSALPRAWIQPPGSPLGEISAPVEMLGRTPNQLVYLASGPGTLVLSEISYPGWRAWVNGEPEPLLLLADLLRGVEIGPGNHRITVSFRPLSFYAGALLTIATLAIWIAMSLVRRKRIARC